MRADSPPSGQIHPAICQEFSGQREAVTIAGEWHGRAKFAGPGYS
jgi:hypothetical protein